VSESRLINKVVVAKGLEQQLVLYWYQSLNRVTASEYWSKAYLVGDAFRSGRTDIAMVRIVIPIDIRDPQGESAAFAEALPFARAVLPAIQHQLFGTL
jgi:EpsI family protein